MSAKNRKQYFKDGVCVDSDIVCGLFTDSMQSPRRAFSHIGRVDFQCFIVDSADSEWTSRGIRTDSVDSACIHGGLCTHGVPADYRCFIADSTDSKRTPCRLHTDYVDSLRTPNTRWTPRGLNGFRLDSTDSRELRAESTWTLCGLLWTFAEVHELCKNKKMLRGVFTLADSALILQKSPWNPRRTPLE